MSITLPVPFARSAAVGEREWLTRGSVETRTRSATRCNRDPDACSIGGGACDIGGKDGEIHRFTFEADVSVGE